MDSCEYPVDAAGKRIPLDTRVLYGEQGEAHAVNYFLYATHSMDPEGHWMVTTGEGKRIQAHYLYGLTGTLGCENPACMVRPRTVIEAEKLAAIAMWNRRANATE